MKTKILLSTFLIFSIGFIMIQIPTFTIVGTNAKFNLFDSFAPISSAFLSSPIAAIAVVLMRFVDAIIDGNLFDKITIIRFFPILAAVFVFSKKRKLGFMIPTIAIVLFNLHPVGRQAWQYSMLWLIPIAAYFLRDRFILARSIETTFTQHAVGGVLWVYFMTLTPQIWLSLIPVVLAERLIIAAGMSINYILFNNLLNYLNTKLKDKFEFNINKVYLLKK